MRRTITPKMLYFGTPVVLISSTNPDGSTNIAPMSSAWWVGSTAVLGMATASQTVANLGEQPACVLNLVPSALVDAIDRLALLTARDDVPAHKLARGYTTCRDKFGAGELTPQRVTGRPDAVAECPVHLHAAVVAIHPIDDGGLVAMEATVEEVTADEAVLRGDHLDGVAWDPLIMKFCDYFGGGIPLRPSSLARGWHMPPLAVAQ
jgi:flavin reductase (DIM6/NTAB) family NADH-FMN oxidoreductase RutF